MAITSTAADLLAGYTPHVATAIILFAVAWLIGSYLLPEDHLSKLPLAGAEFGNTEQRRAAFIKNGKRIYMDAYHKFKDTGVFRITTHRKIDSIAIHPRYLPELANISDDVISFAESSHEQVFSRYTKFRADRPIPPSIVKQNITPSLKRLTPILSEEVEQCILEELGPCNDFTEFNVNSKLLRIIAKVSGRSFVGSELCRSEGYLDMALNYTMEMFRAMQALTRIKPWKRPFVARFVPELKSLAQRTEKAKAFLKPVVDARLKAAATDPYWQKPDDVLQWVLDDGQNRFGKQSDEELANIQLALTFASIHTTTGALTNVFYNLAAMPEIVPELREEIRVVLAEHDGEFTSLALQNLKKLDSFMRETMRYNPMGWTTMGRKVLKTFRLSTGQVIPVGSVLEIPTHAVNFDPDYIHEPERFDAFRCYKIRQEAKEKELEGVKAAEVGAMHQFVTLSGKQGSHNLPFGYGRHACPGRFFAANEMKLILARVILNYDVKMPDGVQGRYPNIEVGIFNPADPTKTLLIKRTQT